MKFVVPGASFTEDLGAGFYFRAAAGGLGLKDGPVALELEIIGFVFVIGVFDEKIDAAAYRTFHVCVQLFGV